MPVPRFPFSLSHLLTFTIRPKAVTCAPYATNKKSRGKIDILSQLFGCNQGYNHDEYCKRYIRNLRQRHTMTKAISAKSKTQATTGRTSLTQVKINTNSTPKMTRILSDLIGRKPLLPLPFQPGLEQAR